MTKLTTDELALARNRREAAIGAIKFFSKSFFGMETHTGVKTVRSANNPFDGLSKQQIESFYDKRNDYMGEHVQCDEYEYRSNLDYEDDPGFVGYMRKGKYLGTEKSKKPDGVLLRRSVYKTEDSLLGSMAQTMRTGMGNCDEKGRIVFGSLLGNPRLTDGKSAVSLVSSNNTQVVKKQKIVRDNNGKKVRVEVDVEKEVGYDHVFVVVADEPIGTNMVRISSLGKLAMVVDGWTQDWYFPNLGLLETKWYGLGNTPNPRQLVVRGNVKKNPTRRYNALSDALKTGAKGDGVGVKKFF